MFKIFKHNNCSPGTPLATTDVYRSVRQVPDLADEGNITALAFPHLQFSIRVFVEAWKRTPDPLDPFRGCAVSLTTETRRPTKDQAYSTIKGQP